MILNGVAQLKNKILFFGRQRGVIQCSIDTNEVLNSKTGWITIVSDTKDSNIGLTITTLLPVRETIKIFLKEFLKIHNLKPTEFSL